MEIKSSKAMVVSNVCEQRPGAENSAGNRDELNFNEQYCGGFHENVLHRLLYLTVWFPLVLFWEGLGTMEEMCH